eukprot:2845374-Amphidinium_carterae.1
MFCDGRDCVACLLYGQRLVSLVCDRNINFRVMVICEFFTLDLVRDPLTAVSYTHLDAADDTPCVDL